MIVSVLTTMFIAFWVIVLGATCVIAAFVTLADPGMLRWALADWARQRRNRDRCGHPDCVHGERRPTPGAYPRTQTIPAEVLAAINGIDIAAGPAGPAGPVGTAGAVGSAGPVGHPAAGPVAASEPAPTPGSVPAPAAVAAPAPVAAAAPSQEAEPAAPVEPAGAGDKAVWFGPYRREELIAEGCSGQVWRVVDTRTGRQVALKQLRPELAADPTARARLAREADRLAAITARHVIGVLEHGEIDGQPYLVMPLAGGGDLARLLRAHRDGLDPDQAVEIITQVADGLDAVHAAGLVHRDLKPANIVLTPGRAGAERCCHLIDLEIASPLTAPHPATPRPHPHVTAAPTTAARGGVYGGHDSAADGHSGVGGAAEGNDEAGGHGGDLQLTPAGCVAGTPAYMAPELFTQAGRSAGIASDVYALGVLAHHLLTGVLPFAGPGQLEMGYQHCHFPAPAPSQIRGGLARFDAVLARALAKNPTDRYSSPVALAADLARAASTPGPMPSAPNPGPGRDRRAPRRRPTPDSRRAALAG